MTLLNTVSNLGGTWPGYFVMVQFINTSEYKHLTQAVDYMTDAPCSVTNAAGDQFKCTSDEAKRICKTLDGQCSFQRLTILKLETDIIRSILSVSHLGLSLSYSSLSLKSVRLKGFLTGRGNWSLTLSRLYVVLTY
jgi:Acetyl-coenzyme A transporter 1